jgi:TRAP-type C4-dicarboxylate transport system permease small subunit
MQPRKLEQYKYFQPIAWTLCLSFAGFVTLLSLQLQSTVANMEQSTLNFDERLKAVEEVVGLNQR